MDKSAEAAQKALYYEQKAKAAESNDAIYLEDEDSVRKLEEKLKNVLDNDDSIRTIAETYGITRQEVQDFFRTITLEE